MNHAWLYKYLPKAEKQQNLPTSEHSFSNDFERKMQRMFKNAPQKQSAGYGMRIAAGFLAVICISGAMLSEPVRGFVGDVLVRETPIWTYLVSEGSARNQLELRNLPPRLLEKYTSLPYPRSIGSIKKPIKCTYYSDGRDDVFWVLQDGRKESEQLLPIDSEDWKIEYICGYRVNYCWKLKFYNGEQRGYDAYAYWYDKNALIIVEGSLTEEELLAVIQELIGG